MTPDASIYTYIRHTGPPLSWDQFVAKYGPAVRAPEWCLTKAERAALEPPRSVLAVAPKQPKRRRVA